MKDLKCPISGVNIPRFLLSVIAGFAFIFAYDFIVHGQLLMPTYLETPQLWRTPEDMQAHFGWMAMTQVLLALITAFIFTRNFEGKGIGEGLRFGGMIGFLLGVSMAGSYAWMPISMNLALSWLASGVVMGLGLGVIYSFTYRPCGWCSKDAAKT
jgi:hypothetical protein